MDLLTAPVAQAISYARIAHCPEDGSPSEIFSEISQAEGDSVFGPIPANTVLWDPETCWENPKAPEKVTLFRKGFDPSEDSPTEEQRKVFATAQRNLQKLRDAADVDYDRLIQAAEEEFTRITGKRP